MSAAILGAEHEASASFAAATVPDTGAKPARARAPRSASPFHELLAKSKKEPKRALDDEDLDPAPADAPKTPNPVYAAIVAPLPEASPVAPPGVSAPMPRANVAAEPEVPVLPAIEEKSVAAIPAASVVKTGASAAPEPQGDLALPDRPLTADDGSLPPAKVPLPDLPPATTPPLPAAMPLGIGAMQAARSLADRAPRVSKEPRTERSFPGNTGGASSVADVPQPPGLPLERRVEAANDVAAPPRHDDASLLGSQARESRERLHEAVSSAVNQLTLRHEARGQIDTPELGRVLVTARSRLGEIDVHVQAERPDAAHALRSHAGDMSAALRTADIPVGNVKIDGPGGSPSHAQDRAATGSFDGRREREEERDEARDAPDAPRGPALRGRVRIVL